MVWCSVKAQGQLYLTFTLFHVVCEGNLPSFQCKKSFDWCTPMGEVDGLSLLFINLNVPALTPQFHCGETALDLSKPLNLFVISGI
jgi:hypothetical protein